LFAEARIEAKKIDEEFATTGKLRGPLHGVPTSFKDQCESICWAGLVTALKILSVDITGIDSSIGFTQWTNKPATSDAHVTPLGSSSFLLGSR
jgi:hypothetical protein